MVMVDVIVVVVLPVFVFVFVVVVFSHFSIKKHQTRYSSIHFMSVHDIG